MTEDTPVSATTTAAKRKGGWPKGKPRLRRSPVAAEPARAPVRQATAAPRMRAAPNWLDVTDTDETVDRLHIPKHLIPDGMDLTWVTETVYNQPMPQYRGKFERGGWTPVHADDFNGQFDGMWTPKGDKGEVKVDGLVLMARPLEISRRAKDRDRRAALEPLRMKEHALISGDIPGVMGSDHPRATRQNSINKSVGPGIIPDRPLVYEQGDEG